MNEQRQQAYLSLINQLLSCDNGDEPRILQENQELFDQGLIEAMVAFAQYLENAGEENNARWLMNKAQQLTTVLEQLESGAFSLTEDEAEEYIQFLVNALQLVEDNPTPESLYPYLRQNLDKLNGTFHKILQKWVDDNVFKNNSVPENVLFASANVIGNFGFLLSNFSLGNTLINKEIVITCYHNVLKIFSLDSTPEIWASFQHQLGTGYLERIKGNRQENLRTAINAFENALKVYSLEKFRQDKIIIREEARTQYNLAYAYLEANNQEMAIIACNEALKVRTFENFPYEWADTQNILGDAYRQRTQGNKNSNLEIAIKAFEAALIVYKSEQFPQKWARIQSNLAVAYRNKTGKNYADNLEVAIKKYKEALEIITPTNSPQEWATISDNLGVAYSNRIKGDKAENLERAISSHLQALQVSLTREKWAMVQSNMGNAYRDRINVIKDIKNKIDNFNKAIECFENALTIWNNNDFSQERIKIYNNLGIIHTFHLDLFDSEEERDQIIENGIVAFQKALEICSQQNNSIEWANIQDNLASAYSIRISGNETENSQESVFHYKEALKVRTYESFPYEWAKTQHNLANAYFNHAYYDERNKTENLAFAVQAYQNALEIRTKDNDPLKCLQTARNLANLYHREKQWQPATEVYHLAIEALENVRLEALNPQSRQETLSNAIDVFHRIVQAHLNLNQPHKALEYVERSKARNLVELMTNKNIEPQGVSQTILVRLRELKQRVVNEQIRLQNQVNKYNISRNDSLNPYVSDYSQLNKYQQELDNFIKQEITITPINRKFKLTQKVESISSDEIQALINAQTCLVEWYLTNEHILSFVITPNSLKVWQSPTEDLQELLDWKDKYLEDYQQNKTQWIKTLDYRLNQLSTILHLDEVLDLIPKTCNQLILIPHYFLHIFPLHTLPLKNGKFLYECFSQGVGYAPSCQLLQLVKERKVERIEEFNQIFAIQNPTRREMKPLLGANLEIARISQYFASQNSTIIAESEASETKLVELQDKIKSTHCLHFSCHGKFNSQSPLDSALFLADPEGNLGESANFTLAEIFEKLDLQQCRLVTLSACESGVVDPTVISDEYIGLPSGFLFAGSLSVVSTLWTVDPIATTLFMTKFYRYLKRVSNSNELNVIIAANKAQSWLRNLNSKKLARIADNQKFQQLLKDVFPNQKLDYMKFQDLLEAAVKRQPYPFANPYYWTAFTATGI